jgi:lipoprotein-anchoring transpeptidase ErfK/SrfK
VPRGRIVRVAFVLALAAAAVGVPLLRAATCSVEAAPHGAQVSEQATPGGLGAGPQPAFAPGRAQPLVRDGAASWWATVARPVAAVRAPSSDTRVATLATATPEGTTNLVLVLGSARRHDVEWVHIRLPVLPNETTAWVPRSALGGYHFVTTHLVIDLRRLRATLSRDGRPVFTAPVGVGQPQWPTPRGQFYVRDKLTDYASPFYGPVAFGTSARSAVLTDWPDGGFVGIHGTDAPGLIPGRVSHGCIRLRNRDIVRLARLMPVGTPLTIE